ncbi:hypothetical protein [Limimaricola cinnabarinus]|uniref:hypothetical protein n=1 Tax=Limimaricola cinnabarinus TaxID=1125964 RepID=UPI002491CA9A|nr:hypothetical protein [Limimaricola cinnabarinus]
MERCHRFWDLHPLSDHKLSCGLKILDDILYQINAFESNEGDQLEFAVADLIRDLENFFLDVHVSCEEFEEDLTGKGFGQGEGYEIPY